MSRGRTRSECHGVHSVGRVEFERGNIRERVLLARCLLIGEVGPVVYPVPAELRPVACAVAAESYRSCRSGEQACEG